jgi:excisionase family DNA binding protein
MSQVERLLYTPEEAALALGISRSTLYVLLSDGRLQSVRLGTRRRIEADALRKFVTSLDVVPPSAVSAHF